MFSFIKCSLGISIYSRTNTTVLYYTSGSKNGEKIWDSLIFNLKSYVTWEMLTQRISYNLDVAYMVDELVKACDNIIT